MASAKAKRILERLAEIKARASEINAAEQTKSGVTPADLAEEAAELGLELGQILTKKE